MENIPAQIKELLKTDGTLKNLRIVFEDESFPDICNDRIVMESLKFEESLSSREAVKFGLCEDSTLSFECVDFGDIRDKFINAYIEVDGTSLYDEMQIPTLGMPPISQRTSEVLGELYILATFYSPVNGYVMKDKTGLVVTEHIGVGGIWYTIDGIDTAYLEEKCGYYGEQIILAATAMGLGTCWIGGTYDRNTCLTHLSKGERLVCVAAVGYSASTTSPHHPHRSTKSIRALSIGLDDAPAWFGEALAAVQLAPSAMNRQSVCF